MAVPNDPNAKLAEYAHPERLVTTEWLAEHLDDPDVVVAESDEDVLLYDTGHIPGAVKIDWHADLNDQVARDYVDAEGFAALMVAKGITRDTTIVFYGDNFNWWAAYALWVCSLFGHADVRLLDGGRQKWVDEGSSDDHGRPVSARPPSTRWCRATTRRSGRSRMTCWHTSARGPWSTCSSPGEYNGEVTHMADYPQEGVLRGGHIPTAASVPWRRAANDDGSFKSAGGPARDLRGRGRADARRRRGRVLPHRRALQPHMVRADPPAGLPEGAQLRRLVVRVGQLGARADREARVPDPSVRASSRRSSTSLRSRRRACAWRSCSTSPTTCRRCPDPSTGIPWSRFTSARRRSSSRPSRPAAG